MQYSPKLKKAMEEMKEILRKHDIAGVVVLHTPGHSEYLNHLNPSYSCASINGEGNLDIKASSKHFSSDAERFNKIKDTSNMLHLLALPLSTCALNLMDASEKMDKTYPADHFGGGHSSHQSQNN